MSLPYFTMAAASAAATPAIASSVALNIFVVVSFYAANIYLQNVNILAAAGIKVGIPPAFLPAGRRGVCRPRPLRSQRRRWRERSTSFAPPPVTAPSLEGGERVIRALPNHRQGGGGERVVRAPPVAAR